MFIAPRVSVLLNLKIKCYSLRRLNLVAWQRNKGNDFKALYLNLLWREFRQIGLLPQSRSTNPPPPDVVFSTVGYKIYLPFTWGSRMVTYKRKIDIRWGTDFGFRLATDFLENWWCEILGTAKTKKSSLKKLCIRILSDFVNKLIVWNIINSYRRLASYKEHLFFF